jgi:hypothetical protein
MTVREELESGDFERFIGAFDEESASLPTVYTSADWLIYSRREDEFVRAVTRPELEERSAPLRQVAARFEPRLLEFRVRRGEIA